MRLRTDSESHPAPFINVTPLIDVLLVLLIIFMVVTPLKQARFEAKVPSLPDDREMQPNPLTLLVTIQPDHTLKLNALGYMGTVEDTTKLSLKLSEVFQEPTRNHTNRYDLLNPVDFTHVLPI